MSEKHKDPPIDPSLALRENIEKIADQLCLAVKGDFSFSIESYSTDQSIQKLCMLLNFVIDTARRALNEVKEHNLKLTELDKLKSDFMTNISHELRTPLTLILAPLESILSSASVHHPEHLENLHRMHRNTFRLYNLVNDLLDFSKVEAGKFVLHEDLVDLNHFATLLVYDAQGLAMERKLTLDFSPCLELPPLMVDPKIMEKIILNLISNALKFTPEGGKVTVQLEKHEDQVHLIVTDTGIGIPSDQISKLFERFHQVDASTTRTHEGTGIGLALISQFAHLMQGNISVESELGVGSRFTVCLPIKQADETEINPDLTHEKKPKNLTIKAPLSKLSLGEKRKPKGITFVSPITGELPLILIADDNPDMRSYIISLLQDKYEIIAVENGQFALDVLDKFHPQAILSDVMMPVMDGFQLTKKIKEDPQLRHIPIILITAKAGKETTIEGFDAGADDYLPKPFSPEELKARTNTAVRLCQEYLKVRDLNNQMSDLISNLSKSKKQLEQSNKKLQSEIEERKILEKKNSALHLDLVAAARRAGMTDIATSTLHNVGNVLNTVNISTTLISQKIAQSKISSLQDLAHLIQDHESDIATFISHDPQGQRIPPYIIKLAHIWQEDKGYLLNETQTLEQGIIHIKEIISKQNLLSSLLELTEQIDISNLIEDALNLNKGLYEQKGIEIIRQYGPLKSTIADRVKLLQIMVNLIKNSIESVLENESNSKKIILQVQEKDDSSFSITIKDNGTGISLDNLKKIFSFGFTTKKDGHGFGLHSSAISAQEMGGTLFVNSDGDGKGASFSLTLPYQPSKWKGQ